MTKTFKKGDPVLVTLKGKVYLGYYDQFDDEGADSEDEEADFLRHGVEFPDPLERGQVDTSWFSDDDVEPLELPKKKPVKKKTTKGTSKDKVLSKSVPSYSSGFGMAKAKIEGEPFDPFA